jgi:hypothetical protein
MSSTASLLMENVGGSPRPLPSNIESNYVFGWKFFTNLEATLDCVSSKLGEAVEVLLGALQGALLMLGISKQTAVGALLGAMLGALLALGVSEVALFAGALLVALLALGISVGNAFGEKVEASVGDGIGSNEGS